MISKRWSHTMLGGWDWDFWTHHQQVLAPPQLGATMAPMPCKHRQDPSTFPGRGGGDEWCVYQRWPFLKDMLDRVGISKKQGALTKFWWTFWVIHGKKRWEKRDTKLTKHHQESKSPRRWPKILSWSTKVHPGRDFAIHPKSSHHLGRLEMRNPFPMEIRWLAHVLCGGFPLDVLNKNSTITAQINSGETLFFPFLSL